jgi:hypothetical protein
MTFAPLTHSIFTRGGISGRKKFANAAVIYMWRHYYRVRMAALVEEKNPQMPPCCVRMAALLVEKNPQMPPCCCSGRITGRKKFANAAVVY